jgi:hypothetical protein
VRAQRNAQEAADTLRHNLMLALDDIERMAQAQRAHGLEHGVHTAVKFEARRRKEIRVVKLPRRVRTRPAKS